MLKLYYTTWRMRRSALRRPALPSAISVAVHRFLGTSRVFPPLSASSRVPSAELIFSVVVSLVLLSVLLFSVTRRRCSLTRSLTCRSE